VDLERSIGELLGFRGIHDDQELKRAVLRTLVPEP